MNDLLTRLIELESEVKYRTPPGAGERDFRYTQGKIPVLISAPHGAAHFRDGRTKEEDEYTAGLSRLIGEQTGAHVLYTYRQSDVDSNWYPNTLYKQTLKTVIERSGINFVIDLHGCAASRDFGIGLGTMHGYSCPKHSHIILKVFSQNGYHEGGLRFSRVDVDQTFSGSGGQRQETITSYVSQILHIPAVQIELNAFLRVVRRLPEASVRDPFEGDLQHILQTIKMLSQLVLVLAEKVVKNQN